MEESKPFWASRTIWVGLVGLAFASLSALGWLPEQLDENKVVDAIMAVLGILTILFRAQATARLDVPAETGR